MNYIIENEAQMLSFAAEIAKTMRAPQVIFLLGDLGAGKTTLTRGLLRAWGYEGIVKSPTFTVVESYEFAGFTVNHFDLYRIESAEELELIGVRDYFSKDAICIIEWPDKAQGLLPRADLTLQITITGEHREITML